MSGEAEPFLVAARPAYVEAGLAGQSPSGSSNSP